MRADRGAVTSGSREEGGVTTTAVEGERAEVALGPFLVSLCCFCRGSKIEKNNLAPTGICRIGATVKHTSVRINC